MGTIAEELLEIAVRLDTARARIEGPELTRILARIDEVATQVAKSWSGSWLGYQSRVYFDRFRPVPPGAHFSQEWGLMDTAFVRETVGSWNEYPFDDVVSPILKDTGAPDLDAARTLARNVRREFDNIRHDVVSALSASLQNHEDPLISTLKEEAEETKAFTDSDFIRGLRPTGQFVSRDMIALGQGIQAPPHFCVMAEVMAIRSPGQACDQLATIARRAASHLSRRERSASRRESSGTSVFIGHGRSPAWKDLKDFLQDRLGLTWDEFNRVPVAGITNTTRLSQMLGDAAIAFVILTAEDEQVDGKWHARLNAVHEAGLFQGRLGFTRAIILLEEGCEEFSNVQGLGQIRFPTANIAAAFEEIRRVLEREEIIST